MKKIFLTILFLFLSLSLSFAQTEMELVSNGGFEDGLTGWNFYSLNPNYASYSLDENSVITGTNSAKIKIDTSYHGYPSGRISLNTVVDIESGVEYTISFKLRSTKPIQGNAIWWAFYDTLETNDYYSGNWGQVKLDADTTIEYTATWTSDFTDPDVLFSLDFAGIQSDDLEIWVDDVSITKIVDDPEEEPLPRGTELISNTDFVNGLTGWNFYSLDSGYADYKLDTEGVIRGANSVMVDIVHAYKGYPSGRISLNTVVDIKEGKKYFIRFKVRSDKPIQGNAIWWAFYDNVETNSYYNGIWGQVQIDADTTVMYETTFTADFTDPDVFFSIDFAGVESDSIKIWLDDIHLIELQLDDEEPPLPEGTELLTNTGFNDGLSNWNFYSMDSGYASYQLDNSFVLNGPNSALVDIITAYKGYPSGRISLNQQVAIEDGKEYYIRFTLKSTKAIQGNAIWWAFYDTVATNKYYNGIWGQVKVDADTAVMYETTFTADFTDPDVFFSIDFAGIESDSIKIWLDDIHLIEIKKVEPIISKALAFNLSEPRDEYVVTTDTTDIVSGDDWTMEGWFKFANFDAPGGEEHLMRLGAQLFVNGNNLKVQADGNYVAGTTSLVVGKWYHIAYVRTAANVTVYLDGVKEIDAPGADAGTANRFLIGSYKQPHTSYNFAGIIDEIRLWDVARTEAEINEAKDVELTGTENGLVVYYDFNNGSDSTVIDRAGGDNNGKLGNMDTSNWVTDSPFVNDSIEEPPLPEGTDLLSNNYFNDGLDKWDLSKTVQSYATLSLDESSALEGEKSGLVHINNVFTGADESWKIQLRQLELDGVKEDNGYHIQFMIKANKDVSGISAVIQKRHGDFGNIYSKDISLVADEMLTVIDTFDCAVTDTNVIFGFNMGTASVKDVDIWFDAVHLIEMDGYTVDVKKEDMLPKVYALNQNYPNPFNPTTVISFALPKTSDVQLSVYNILGQKVMELVNGKMVAGNHIVNFNAGNLASGMYIYRLQAGNFVSVRKMLLMK